MRARRALLAVALLTVVVAAVVLAVREPSRTAVATRAVADAPTPTPAPAPKAPHFEGHYHGTSYFALATPTCAMVDTVLDAEFVVSSSETWQLHNQYCGTITDGRFTASGTFTFAAPDGSTLSGTSQTTDVVLADNGGPIDLRITNGSGRFDGATGSCSLDNTVRNLEFGHQEQSGSFQCDIVSATSPSEPPPCRSDQLTVRLMGIQGTSQHLVGSYWIADSSPDPCLLDASATVDLLDAQGAVLATIVSTNDSDVPIRLNENTVLPDHPTPVEGIAGVNVWWAENDIPAGGVPCQQPLLRPAAVRLHLGDATITTDDVAWERFTIAICGDDRVAVGPTPI